MRRAARCPRTLLLLQLLHFFIFFVKNLCVVSSKSLKNSSCVLHLHHQQTERQQGPEGGSSLPALSSANLHAAFLLHLPYTLQRPQLKSIRECSAATTSPAAGTAPAAAPEAGGDTHLSLLERVQTHQDVAAAEQLLQQWEQQRDALLLTSWDGWAAAVGVSVQQLQQVVLLVHTSPLRAAAEQQRKMRKAAAAAMQQSTAQLSAAAAATGTTVAAAAGAGGSSSSGAISCADGVMSSAAYELFLPLLHAEAALLLKGPQSGFLLPLHRPPSVQEWAAAAAVDAAAADAAAAASRAVAVSHSAASAAAAALAEFEAPSEGALRGETRQDVTAAERQQRAELQRQLEALHLLLLWQQQQLAVTATAVVRRFRAIASARQGQRLAAAERTDLAAAAAGIPKEEELLLMALQHAREGLKKHALDNVDMRSRAAAAAPTSNNSSSSSKSSSSTAPSWVAYWGWLQQGMVRWSRMQRVPYEIPLSWWTAASALRRLRHQQETEELQQLQQPQQRREQERMQQACDSLSMSPQRLRAIQLATRRPISTEAELTGLTPHKGERCDRVGELLVADGSAREQEEQQMLLNNAATEVWQFAAAALEPQELEALQKAANGPMAHAALQKEPLLEVAVRRFREAELKRLMQQLPESQRAAAAANPEMQQQLLSEQSNLLRVVRDACSQ